jgi:hypothetical protein
MERENAADLAKNFTEYGRRSAYTHLARPPVPDSWYYASLARRQTSVFIGLRGRRYDGRDTGEKQYRGKRSTTPEA